MTSEQIFTKFHLEDKDLKKISEALNLYAMYASTTQDVDTDSLTGFWGIINRWREMKDEILKEQENSHSDKT